MEQREHKKLPIHIFHDYTRNMSTITSLDLHSFNKNQTSITKENVNDHLFTQSTSHPTYI